MFKEFIPKIDNADISELEKTSEFLAVATGIEIGKEILSRVLGDKGEVVQKGKTFFSRVLEGYGNLEKLDEALEKSDFLSTSRQLEDMLSRATDENKRQLLQTLLDGYKKFWDQRVKREMEDRDVRNQAVKAMRGLLGV